MKKSDILLNSLLYGLYMFISCLVIMFAEILVIRIIDIIIELSPLTLCIIRALIYLLGVNAILAIVAYREGYKYLPPVHYTAISAVIAALLHFIFALLFNFSAFCAGGVRFITMMYQFGPQLNIVDFEGQITSADCIPFFFVIGLIYVVVMSVASFIGKKIREKSRKDLNIA